MRAQLNRTLELTKEELAALRMNLFKVNKHTGAADISGKIINGDLFKILDFLPDNFIDLLFVDPPYNLDKRFNSSRFKEMNIHDYEIWIDSWLSRIVRMLKPTSSIYICGDWKSSSAIYNVANKYFTVRNRITWEREKGRGAKSNWKNCSEDIWYCTRSNKFTFNVNNVMIKRRVLAPYKTDSGKPKDWTSEGNSNYRITFPSNIWTDITVPFWSMPENTDHPTQKPEKLLAKIILASSNPGDMVFDPFMGSGTTAVAAKKLGRSFSGVELDELFCCLAEKRLFAAENDKSIQGYNEGVFWERNTLRDQKKI